MFRWVLLLIAWCSLSPAYAADAIKIVAFGDSLVAGYGLEPSESLPIKLEQALHQAGYAVTVMNAGISGDTTAGGKARVDKILAQDPDIVILALGANDMLRGMNPQTTYDNLNAIIEALQQKNVIVVLSGMKAAFNMGPRFSKQFNSIYPTLAKTHKLIYQPFFLEDVATQSTLNQPDGVHPNAEGVTVLVKHLLPYIEKAIKTFTEQADL